VGLAKVLKLRARGADVDAEYLLRFRAGTLYPIVLNPDMPRTMRGT
jgi:hypothetical protein